MPYNVGGMGNKRCELPFSQPALQLLRLSKLPPTTFPACWLYRVLTVGFSFYLLSVRLSRLSLSVKIGRCPKYLVLPFPAFGLPNAFFSSASSPLAGPRPSARFPTAMRRQLQRQPTKPALSFLHSRDCSATRCSIHFPHLLLLHIVGRAPHFHHQLPNEHLFQFLFAICYAFKLTSFRAANVSFYSYF